MRGPLPEDAIRIVARDADKENKAAREIDRRTPLCGSGKSASDP
jgi:hypothetical protein